MTFDEVAAKFRGCAEYVDWPEAKTERIIVFVRTMETLADMAALTPLLSATDG
jgi:hypothetical protein